MASGAERSMWPRAANAGRDRHARVACRPQSDRTCHRLACVSDPTQKEGRAHARRGSSPARPPRGNQRRGSLQHAHRRVRGARQRSSRARRTRGAQSLPPRTAQEPRGVPPRRGQIARQPPARRTHVSGTRSLCRTSPCDLHT
eukprot:scaffold201055_cov29-Tisochrysis_lutea.AAC.2